RSAETVGPSPVMTGAAENQVSAICSFLTVGAKMSARMAAGGFRLGPPGPFCFSLFVGHLCEELEDLVPLSIRVFTLQPGNDGGNPSHGRKLKELPEWNLNVEADLELSDELSGVQGVTTQFKEAVFNADTVKAEQFLPDFCDS